MIEPDATQKERKGIFMREDNKIYHTSIYRIILKERLECKWTDWFGETTISYMDGKTILITKIKDQTSLHGLLDRVRDLNLTLLSIEYLGPSNRNKKNTN